ncbi:MAG: AAA family ATPase [candidate division WOR-3 bacterium]|nr:AAA family ATPase [candidate division WOR-3 bacterium]
MPGRKFNAKNQIDENASVVAYLPLLLKPNFWGRDVKKVNLIQTHTSWVFLTGKYAYKIKKPVFFGFLDYTSLSAREYFCKEEFRINQLLAPDIYYQVIPIVKIGNKVALATKKNKHQIIDYAIKMRELPQEAIMTNRLKHRNVNYATIDEIARTIARFHNQQVSKPDFFKFGSLEIIKYNWDENFAQTEPFINITINKKIFTEIKSQVEKFMDTNRSVFEKRIADLKIKQCHGDLHSQNIFVIDEHSANLAGKKQNSAVYIFDCLEFNPRFAISDVASEIAFFVMDLEFYQHKHLADFFIARYLNYTNDWEMLKVLDFYKCYRAYVRGKVTSFNLNDRGISSTLKQKAKIEAKQYFALADKYARHLFLSPKLILIMGLPGVGKTYLAQHLSEHISAYHLCSDIIRKEITNTPIETHCFEGYGKGIYAPEVSKRTYEELYRRAENYLTQGKICIVDATFLWEKSRQELKAIAEKYQAQFYIIECTCPEKVVLKRMQQRKNEFSLSDATPEIYYKLKENLEQVKEKKNYLKVDTSRPIKANLKKIIHFLTR